MKVTVIGAAGFIGRTLSGFLATCGHDVTGMDVSAGGAHGLHQSYHTVDLTTDAVGFSQGTDAVFFLAQSPHYREFPDHAHDLFAVNTLGAIKAAHAAIQAGVRFFCYASTGSVYQPAFVPMRETHPVRRDEPYALSKLMAEEALALFADKMNIVNLRLFGVFGPGQKDMLPVRILNMIRRGEPIILEPSPIKVNDKDGLVISYCYVGDAVRCLLSLARMALDDESLPLQLNIAGPDPISIRQLAETLGGVIGTEPIFTLGNTPRNLDLIADISLLRSVLHPSFTAFKDAMIMSFHKDCP